MIPNTAERHSSPAQFSNDLMSDQSESEQEGGMTMARNANSPSGQFGMPIQRQAAPNAVVQRKPSDEIPDLEEEVVAEINAAIKAGKKRKALDLVLAALVAKDASKFNVNNLHLKKLHWVRGGDSSTVMGPKFKKWLTAEMKKAPADVKKDEDESKKYLATLTVPDSELDIKINIAEERFISAPRLYSVTRHEFIHYDQVKANPFRYLSSSEFPRGYANPSEDSSLALMEVEAYLWEAEHVAETGVDKDPQYVWNVFTMLNEKWGESVAKEARPLKRRWLKAMGEMWKVAVSGYLDQCEALITKAGTDPMEAKDFSTLEGHWIHLEDFWGYRINYRPLVAPLKPRVDKIEKYIQDFKDDKKAAQFGKKIKLRKREFKSARRGSDGFNVFVDFFNDWDELNAKGKAANKAEFEKAMGPIWIKSFDMLDKRMKSLFKKDKDDDYLVDLANAMRTMLRKASESGVDTKVKEEKQAILDQWKKDIGLR